VWPTWCQSGTFAQSDAGDPLSHGEVTYVAEVASEPMEAKLRGFVPGFRCYNDGIPEQIDPGPLLLINSMIRHLTRPRPCWSDSRSVTETGYISCRELYDYCGGHISSAVASNLGLLHPVFT
jgi:hypothetical protein